MFTKQLAIRTARKLLKKMGYNVICLDMDRVYSSDLTRLQFQNLVDDLIMDTMYWEGM